MFSNFGLLPLPSFSCFSRLKVYAEFGELVFGETVRKMSDFVGGGGDDDDSVAQTHPKQYHHKSRFTRYLQHFREVGPSHVVTNCTLDFANDIGLCEGFRRKLEIGWGKLVLKIFCTVFKVLRSCLSPLLPTVLLAALLLPGGVLASLSHVQLASLFLMFRRCCASGFGSV